MLSCISLNLGQHSCEAYETRECMEGFVIETRIQWLRWVRAKVGLARLFWYSSAFKPSKI